MGDDKIQHFKAGTLAALFGVGIGAVLALAGLSPWGAVPACALVAAAAAGITKEAADRLDNIVAAGQGLPPVHGVSLLDALATALPGAVLAVVADQVLRALPAGVLQ